MRIKSGLARGDEDLACGSVALGKRVNRPTKATRMRGTQITRVTLLGGTDPYGILRRRIHHNILVQDIGDEAAIGTKFQINALGKSDIELKCRSERGGRVDTLNVLGKYMSLRCSSIESIRKLRSGVV